MKKLLIKLLAVFLVALMAVSVPLQVFAVGTNTYVSDIMVASAASVAAAKKLLTKAGYTPIASDVNEGNDDVVCIGYKTTTNKDEAITDLAIMNMNGGYSFEEYDHVLTEYKETVDKLVDELYVAVSEYRTNYKAGTYGAQLANILLNRFYDEDFGTENNLLGDILASDDLTKEQLTVIFMQATTLAMTVIESCLAIACSDNWLDRMLNMPANTTYTTADDDNARIIYKSFAGFQEEMQQYVDILDASNLTMESSEEEWAAYNDTLTEVQQDIVMNYSQTYNYLMATEYKDGTLYDFFMQDLDEIDNADLYPMAKAMTAGQIATVNYASLCTALQYSVFTDDMMKAMVDGVQDQKTLETVSVFEGVDRSIFSSDGIALTNEAMRQATSTSDYTWYKGNLSKETETLFYSIMGVAAGIGAAGIAVYALASAKVDAFVTASYQFAFGTVRFVNTGYLPPSLVDVENGETLAQAMESADVEDFVHALNPEQFKEARGVLESAQANTSWSTVAGAAKIISAVAIAVVLITLVIYLVKEYKSYKKRTTYTDIPRIIVDQTIAADGTRKYTYYYAAKDTQGNLADLNNWTGDEWNALYYTKDAEAGNPILAKTLVQDENVAKYAGYEPVHAFGSDAAYNLNKYTDGKDTAIYLFFAEDTTSGLSGTTVSYGNYALVAAGGLVIGAAGMYLVNKSLRKKKQTGAAEA